MKSKFDFVLLTATQYDKYANESMETIVKQMFTLHVMFNQRFISTPRYFVSIESNTKIPTI